MLYPLLCKGLVYLKALALKGSMLQQLRRGAGSWVAKLLLGLLVLSFGLWGIGDIFRNFGGHTVASIGRTEISIESFRKAYDSERQLLARRAGKPISNEQAEALGLREYVLSQLEREATFDEEARRLGLNVSKGLIIRDIMQDPSFKGATGSFDRLKFEQLLYGNGYNEALYIQQRMVSAKRRMLAQSLISGIEIPDLYNEAINRLKNEERIVDYIILSADKFSKIQPPSEEDLAKYYNLVKAAYNTVERRKLKLLTLKAEDFAKTIKISDEELRAIYDSQIEKFSKPEKRQIEQIAFKDLQSAKAIALQLKANPGAVDQLLPKDAVRSDLGLLTKKEFIEPTVAEAAFSLPLNTYSALINGQFGPVIVRITKIEEGSITSFEKAKSVITQSLVAQRTRDALFDAHDKIETERASGARLDEIAEKLKLSLTTTPAIDKQGTSEDGKSAGIEPAVIQEAFQSEQGIDNEPIQLANQNWVWFEVEQIIPERERPLVEVRKQVEDQWLSSQQRVMLSEKARAFLEEIKKGKPFSTLAHDLQLTVKSTASFKRDGKPTDFSPSAVSSAFRIAVNGADTGLASNNKDRLLFIVKKDITPAPTQKDDKLIKSINESLQEEALYEYIAAVQQSLKLSVNKELAERQTAGSAQ
jgi:peptidyl-prolyl cis-trans isomerase D